MTKDNVRLVLYPWIEVWHTQPGVPLSYLFDPGVFSYRWVDLIQVGDRIVGVGYNL